VTFCCTSFDIVDISGGSVLNCFLKKKIVIHGSFIMGDILAKILNSRLFPGLKAVCVKYVTASAQSDHTFVRYVWIEANGARDTHILKLFWAVTFHSLSTYTCDEKQ
jgi:hypothetical protein